MLRINVVSIATGVVLVFIAALLRYLYVISKLGLKAGPRPVGVGISLLSHHPLLYAVIVFFVGLYVGGRIFHR
jgi:hypothetical protein